MSRFCTLRALLLLALLGQTTAAQASPASRAHDRGERALRQANYSEALEQFKIAQDAKPSPARLRQIGECYRMLGQHPEAVAAFKSYLEQLPGASDRAEVESRIAESEDYVRVMSEPPGAAPAPPPVVVVAPPPAEAPLVRRWYVWTGAVGVVAVLALAIGLGVGFSTPSLPPATLTTVDAR